MILNGKFGSSTKTGNEWEIKTDFKTTVLSNYKTCSKTLEVIDPIFGDFLGIFYVPKNKLYEYLKENYNIEWKSIFSKKLIADEVIINTNTKSVFVFEKKFQNCNGSVDEKIETGNFKKKQFEKIFKPLNYKVFYIYLLNDWFKQEKYKDVMKYIKSIKCEVFFNQISDEKIKEIFNTKSDTKTSNQNLQLVLFS